ncbi:hypothetical protein ZWY2020_006217 [Hordeum vulgare]|nr:hypothetical protein ZWY2020_006217 [Hordeum vulgare]
MTRGGAPRTSSGSAPDGPDAMADTEVELVCAAVSLTSRASDIASFTSFDSYVPERAAADTAISENTYALALDDPEGSTAETSDEGE